MCGFRNRKLPMRHATTALGGSAAPILIIRYSKVALARLVSRADSRYLYSEKQSVQSRDYDKGKNRSNG